MGDLPRRYTIYLKSSVLQETRELLKGRKPRPYYSYADITDGYKALNLPYKLHNIGKRYEST